MFSKFGDAGALGLCWIVTIINQSDSKLSIVSYQVEEVTNRRSMYRSGFLEVEEMQGGAAALPIYLDAGEARSYVVRVPIGVSEAVAKVIDELKTARAKWSVQEAQSRAFSAGFDLVGNPVEVKSFDGGATLVSWKDMSRLAVAQVRFETGRGNAFSKQLNGTAAP